MSISTTIDQLIQHANDVKVCQEQMKLIANGLTRLQNALNHGNHAHEDIEQTLKAIDTLIASCNENEVDLNGVSYKDLQSLLFRLQWRLAQHEANMTDDQNTKIQRLNDAYGEMHTLVEQTIDEATKQRLQEIEQYIKERTMEQLRLLREKHTPGIESYLRSCIELHKGIPLPALTAEAIAKVTDTFYQVPTTRPIHLELPFTRLFTRLDADKFTAFERNELRRLLNTTDEGECLWQRLVSTPYMQSAVERNLSKEEKDLSEENIIRTNRWIVILGDPGSGKTSFVRWLVRHLAQTFLLNDQHSTEYGPLRIPILIRVGEFAKSLNRNPSLTVFDYIGKRALQDYVEQGQALIILDGLDEIPASEHRAKLIRIVEKFVDTHVQIPTGASALDNSHLNRLLDDPSKTGGNQLIITSRIVGYHAAPLAGQFSHYTIQPMDTERINKFVNYWFVQSHQQILDAYKLTVPNQGESHAAALTTELKKVENTGLLTVASNPSLISIICNMSFNQLDGTPLPAQRICQYDQIVEAMLSLWSSKQSTIPKAKLLRILSDIALHIHKYSSSNSIDEEDLQDVCFQTVKTFKNKLFLSNEDLPDIENQTTRFVPIIKEEVGVLAIRDRSLYSFLHLPFQEYFTCLQLIETDRSMQINRNSGTALIVQSLRHHMNDPRFRIPIALALGHISGTWSQTNFDAFCRDFIEEQDDSNALLPYGPYILLASNADLINYPSNDIFFAALDRLITAAGQHRWSTICPFLFDQMTIALSKLREDIVSQWISHFLAHSSSYDPQTIVAFCHLIEGKPYEFENIKWLDQSSCSILQSLSILDNEKNEFPIDRLLVKVAFSNHQLLPTNLVTLKGFLLDKDIPSHSISINLLPMIIILYGGLKRDNQTVLFDPSYIHRESTVVTPFLIRFLSITDHTRQDQDFKKLKQDCIKSFLARIESHDESCEAIDLCIATVCLYGIEYIQENLTIIPNSLLRMTLDRLKYLSMILRQLYFTGDENDRTIEDETTKFISLAIGKFQYGESARVQFLDLLDFLKDGVVRLRSSETSTLLQGESKRHKRLTLNLPNTLRKEDKFLHGLLSTDTRLFPSDRNSCSLLYRFIKLFWILEHSEEFSTQYRAAVALDTVPEYLVLRHDEDVLSSLTFIPSHLQNLYLRLMQQKLMIIHSNEINANERQCLYFGHILTECLTRLSNTSCKRVIILGPVITLLPWLRMQHLENFGSSLLWALGTKESDYVATVEAKRKRPINDETGQYTDTDDNIFNGSDRLYDEMRRNLIRDYIKQERQHLQTTTTENRGRNMELYSASITLANICRWGDDDQKLSLLNESVRGAMLITNKVTRLDALCVIALHSHSDHDQIQASTGRSLRAEIEYQFNDIYPNLPLLVHTAIFIRCLPLLRHHQMIDQCLQNLFEKFADNDQRDKQAVNEALAPFLQSDFDSSPFSKYTAHHLSDNNRFGHSRSTVLKRHFTMITDEHVPFSVLISNLYVIELSKDFHTCLKTDARQFTMDETIVSTLCQFENTTLTAVQAMTITNILCSASQTERLRFLLNNALHRVSAVELRARHLVEPWLNWKDSNELSPFADHAALLLTNSDLWSVEAANIICDLLRSENDRFRHRTEIVFRSSTDDDARTSSKLGIDVILTLMKKRVYYQLTSASARLNVTRLFMNITLDIQSHLETMLWLERYRIHVLNNRNYSFKQARSWTNPYVASYFSPDVSIDACSCINIFALSSDLMIYLCDMIASNFFSYLAIDGDTTSNAVLESHTQFVTSVVVSLDTLFNRNEYVRQMALEALMQLFEICGNDEIRRAVACALGYVCGGSTYKSLFEKLRTVSNNENREIPNGSSQVLVALISSYSYCVGVHKIAFDQDDIDLFSGLLTHSSNDVVKAVRIGYGRVTRDSSILIDMFGFDDVQCYHALIESTAYLYLYEAQEDSENEIADFIERNPIYLSVFITQLYDSIRHFTDNVIPIRGNDYDLAYGYPQYAKVASLVVQRIPAAFCAYVKDWPNGEELKKALFYTSKQHNFPQRAACLTILSAFGELTVDLCEMLMNAQFADPYIQNTADKCLACIKTMKDEKGVLNLLFSHLKSKSMDIRYLTGKILLHLSKLSLIPFQQVQTIFNGVILDPHSNEDLWLIEEQTGIFQQYLYYYAGPLKDAIYSLLIQHLSGETSASVRRNELNAIDSNFIEAEKAARLASCLYEAKVETDPQVPPSPPIADDPDSASLSSFADGNDSD